MSKYNNVNPGQYKVAGRERPGDGLLQEQEKRELRQREAALGSSDREAAAAGRKPATSRKRQPARGKRRTTQSLLMRSAEVVGRTLGGLQREIERTAQRITGAQPLGVASDKGAQKARPTTGTRKRRSTTGGSPARPRRRQPNAGEPESPGGDGRSD